MYTLDTNPIIYYTGNDSAAIAALDIIFEQHTPFFISVLTELELFSSAKMSVEEEIKIERFLSTVRIVPVTSSIARIASDLRRLSTRLKAFDSVIATALFTNSTLVTRNKRDFEQIKGLEILAI